MEFSDFKLRKYLSPRLWCQGSRRTLSVHEPCFRVGVQPTFPCVGLNESRVGVEETRRVTVKPFHRKKKEKGEGTKVMTFSVDVEETGPVVRIVHPVLGPTRRPTMGRLHSIFICSSYSGLL